MTIPMHYLEPVQKTVALSNIEASVSIAKQLAEFAKTNRLTTNIQGKEYMNVSGWQFALALLGVTAIVRETRDLSTEGEYKYYAKCELVNMSTGMVVGSGEALCSNKESKKRSFDEFAIHSMAQTRSIGKAARNLCGYLAMAAGFDATPLEEIEGKIEQASTVDDLKKGYAKHASKFEANPELKQLLTERKAQILKESETTDEQPATELTSSKNIRRDKAAVIQQP